MPSPCPRGYLPPTYRRVKKLQVLIIKKDVRKSLARKKVNENPIWIWNGSVLGANKPRKSLAGREFCWDLLKEDVWGDTLLG